jgi:hypothetical protein
LLKKEALVTVSWRYLPLEWAFLTDFEFGLWKELALAVLFLCRMGKQLKIGLLVIGIATCAIGFCLAIAHARVQPNAASEACKKNLRQFEGEVQTWTNTNNLLPNSNGVSNAR